MDYRVRNIILLMKSDLRREIRLGDMARAVNLTPEHLCRLFRTETGSSPARYLKRLRMQEARSLLETTCLRVKEIGAIVGAHDESHFVRDFEAACGLPPAKYRALHLSTCLVEAGPARYEIKNG